jgi:hypothetical protein
MAGVDRIGGQLAHFFAAAGDRGAGRPNHADDVAAMLTDIKACFTTHNSNLFPQLQVCKPAFL